MCMASPQIMFYSIGSSSDLKLSHLVCSTADFTLDAKLFETQKAANELK